MAQGLMTFSNLRAALDAGFEKYDKTKDGYLMRIKTANGFAFALVVIKGIV